MQPFLPFQLKVPCFGRHSLDLPDKMQDNAAEFIPILENEYKGSTSKELMEEGLPCDCNYSQSTDEPGSKLKLSRACGWNECINRALAIECDPGNCPCGLMCQNQRFQRRLYARVEVRSTPGKGSGLFAMEDLESGTFVIEYIGEVLDQAAFSKRQAQLERDGQRHFYFMTLRSTQTIDASRKGNLSRFINHSCNPNCATEKWIVNRRMCVGIFAIKPIKKGTELTFDYKFERFGNKAQACNCGESNCNGFIGKKKVSCSWESDDYEDEGEKTYFTKSTLSRLLKRAHPLENSEGIYKVCKELVRAENDSHSVYVHLKALTLTENLSVLRRFLHLHGLSILQNIFASYSSYPQVLSVLLEALDKLPVCTRNSIEDCRILPVLEEHKPNLDAEVVDKLVAKWNSLESVYRIPKIKPAVSETLGVENPTLTFNSTEPENNPLKRSNGMFSSFKQPKRIEQAEKQGESFSRNTHNSFRNEHKPNQQPKFQKELPVPVILPEVPVQNSCLVEGVSPVDLENFMARTKALMKSKQAPPAISNIDSSHVSKESKEKYRALISVVVVKCLSKSKNSFSNEMFKKIARKLTHSLLEKEIKINPFLSLPSSENLSEETIRMIKKYCNSQIPKILLNLDS